MSQWLIGLDEAGYGPNLGPLTIAGCSWMLESDSLDLYQILNQTVSPDSHRQNSRLQIADSKMVYQRGDLRSLELPVLAAIYAAYQTVPGNFRELIECLNPLNLSPNIKPRPIIETKPSLPPWQNVQDWQSTSLPISCSITDVIATGKRLSHDCQAVGVSLKQLACLAIFPDEFNRLLADHGNKGTLLSTKTLEIASCFLDSCPDHSVHFFFDKHGGRSKYGPFIQHIMTDQFVFAGIESPDSSQYHFLQNNRTINLSFNARGETCLATALGSMIAKYCREIAMLIWNKYWGTLIPNLKPTQGYPQDAKRFMKDIDSTRLELKLAAESIWRTK